MQTYQTYFKREFDKKRENSGVLARFVLFLAGILKLTSENQSFSEYVVEYEYDERRRDFAYPPLPFGG